MWHARATRSPCCAYAYGRERHARVPGGHRGGRASVKFPGTAESRAAPNFAAMTSSGGSVLMSTGAATSS